MQNFRGYLSIMIGILLAGLIPAAIFAESLNLTALKPYGTSVFLEQSGIYEKAAEQVKRSIADNAEANSSPVIRKYVRSIMERAVNATVTPQWIGSKLELAQTSLWDYLLGKTERPRPIPIKELKLSVRAATIEELNRLPREIWLIPGLNKEKLAGELANGIPEEVTWKDIASDRSLASFSADYRMAVLGLKAAYVLIMLMILLQIWLAGSLKKGLRGVGRTWTVSGGLTILLAGCLWNCRSFIGMQQFPDNRLNYREELLNAVSAALHQTSIYSGAIGLAVMMLGIFALLLGRSGSRRTWHRS
ncbi:hypothetical protein [Ferviditalea candida]|uniref:Uncharacterized protein n=1 Tax=Ferviditalea candida TaxID=3108399 RepID=A0ABU5ZIA3_9BACL|nr:hypothetical protein [Paenibacillaceae bacterium T2]